MGFFDSFTGKTPSQNVAATGLYAAPREIRGAYTWLGGDVGKYLTTEGAKAKGMPAPETYFTPMAQTADETRAFDMMREGLTPTAESLGRDISMLSNPFDEYVINDINRQAAGDYSILKQALNEAGQMGSNRSVLGANDIDLTRLNQIGKFRQENYNKALDTSLSKLTALRAADAESLLGIGDFQRSLDYQTKQAPISAIMAAGSGIAPLQGVAQNFGSPATTIKGNGSDMMTTLGNIGKVMALFG